MDESKEAVSQMSEERQNSDQGGESMHLLQSISRSGEEPYAGTKNIITYIVYQKKDCDESKYMIK